MDLPERAARHVTVLRLRQGDAVMLFDGQGGEYPATLGRVSRNAVEVRIHDHRDIERESPLQLILAQCLSAGERMDLTLQKATELGISAIVPLCSERSVVRLSAERAERKLEHWRSVVIAACEQCGRNSIPEIAPATDLLSWLATLPPAGTRLMLDPLAEDGLAARPIPQPGPVTLLVGPEGGLAGHECAAAIRKGFRGVTLGPRILRTETAPLAAISILQSMAGDLR